MDNLEPSERQILRRSVRTSLFLTLGGVGSMVIAIGIAIWWARSSERTAVDRIIQLKKVQGDASSNKRTLEYAQKYLTGQASSLVVSQSPVVNEALHPRVSYVRKGWKYNFVFAVDPTESLAPRIKAVRYHSDGSVFPAVEVNGENNRNFELHVEVPTCTSTVTATVEVKDEPPAIVRFDWCKISGWSDSVHYDPSKLHWVGFLPWNCVKTRAILMNIPESLTNRIDRLQELRQLYRADSRWQPKGGVSAVTFEAWRSSRNRQNVVIVANCKKPETCVDLAAAYYALAGGMLPELYCGSAPAALVSDEPVTLKQLPDGDQAEPNLVPRSAFEQCFRLSACEVATGATTVRYPISACTSNSISKELRDCSMREQCAEVLSCANAAYGAQ